MKKNLVLVERNIYLISACISISIYLYLFYYPLNLSGLLVSPSKYAWIDIDIYIKTADALFNDLNKIIDSYVDFYTNPSEIKDLYTGILLPFIIKLFQYSNTNTLPLSLLFLVVGIAVNFLWIYWAKCQKKDGVAVFFLLFPYFYFYSTTISTEIIFALITTALFILTDTYKVYYSKIILLLLVTITLLRPSSVIIIFLYLYMTITQDKKIKLKEVTFLFLLLVFGLLYYLPYFIDFSKTTAQTFLNIDPKNICVDNMNNLGECFLYYIGKLLHIFGIRPIGSGGEIVFHVRTLFGIIIIIGLVPLIQQQNKFHIAFVLFQLIPLLYGHATERYAIYFYPLLYYYSITSIKSILKEK